MTNLENRRIKGMFVNRARNLVRATHQVLFGLIFLLACVFITQSVQAATLFSDDFSSGNYNNWSLPAGSGATFTVVNGELRQTNTAPGLNKPWILYPNGYGWIDYELNLKARHVSGYYDITDIRVYFRMQSDQTSGYFLQLHGLNWVELFKMSGTTLASVQKSSLPFSTPNYTGYTIKIKVSGNSIKVWVDGTQYIDVTDNTYSSGTIGLGSSHVVAGFDDIVVTDSTSSSTPSFTKIGSLPITVDGLTSIFDPATKLLYLFPNWPNYLNQVYRTTHDASDSLSWSQITTGPNNWNYWGRPEVLPGVAVYFTGAFYQGSTIYLANINSNGTLGSWRTTTNMLNQYWARALHQSQIYNGKFYINGGWQSDYGPNYDDIIAATVNSDGTLGNFTRVGTLPYQVLGHSTYLANNKMYFVHEDKIQIANINSDGSIGSFVSQTYPISHANYGTRGIVVIDNYLVVNDRQKTHIFQLNSSGNVTGLLYTINNPVEFNERYVYVNNNKVYILDRSGVYRLDGLGGSVNTYTLSVTKTGTASYGTLSTVTSNPAGINCGSTCSAAFGAGNVVTLTATGASNVTFAGWSGDCSGSSNICTVTMNSGKNVTATFNQTQCSYSINPTSASIPSTGGTSSLAVTASPTGCSGTWTAVSNDSWITITSGSSGTGNGSVMYTVGVNTGGQRTGTITVGGQTHTVIQAGVSQYTLTVTKSGTGSGNVTAAGCTLSWNGNTGTCSANSGTAIVLTGAANTGATFGGWSNGSGSASGCSGTGSCSFTLTANSGITATFNQTQCSYSIAPTNASIPSTGGSGSVAVTVSPSGCNGQWTAVSNDSWITITSGSNGTGNGTVMYTVGVNTGGQRTGTITVGGQTHTVIQAGVSQYTLTVTKSGTGSGSVISSPAGVDCGSTCVGSFGLGTNVTLTAMNFVGSTFDGWSGDCVSCGTNSSCTINMNTQKSCTALFNRTQCTYSINASNQSCSASGGTGTITVNASSFNCQWTASSDSNWLILNPVSGTGNGTVNYSCEANTSTSTRTGTATIAGHSIQITQTGQTQQTSANRALPTSYTAGQPVNVTITIVPPTGTVVTGVEETPPSGWMVTDINQGGEFNNGKVKWVFFDGNQRTLTYKATPYIGMSGTATFSGEAMFNQTKVSIGGNTSITGQGGSSRDPIYRFYNTYTGGHFFTDNPDEKDYVIRELPDFRWESDGAYYIYRTQQAGTSPVYRLFNTYGVGHYYTISETDKDAKVAQGYALERVGFYAYTTQVSGTKPVYYFNLPANLNNGKEAWFYTISEAEKNLIITTMPVWVYKGIAFYAYEY